MLGFTIGGKIIRHVPVEGTDWRWYRVLNMTHVNDKYWNLLGFTGSKLAFDAHTSFDMLYM